MIIIREKKESLTEMASLIARNVPKAVKARTKGMVIEDSAWFYDWAEKPNEATMTKVAFVSSLNGEMDFYYGFVRPYVWNKGSAKISGAETNPKWDFRVLLLHSKVENKEGLWFKNSFKDSEFEKVYDFEKKLFKVLVKNWNNELLQRGVQKVIQSLSLIPTNKNILQICGDLLQKK